MPEIVSWSYALDVKQGPRINGSSTVTVDAYDKLSVVLAAGASAVDVELQPSDKPGKVRELLIRASHYSTDTTYSPDGGSTTVPLDGPVTLIGSGAVSLLTAAPQTLQLTNGTSSDVAVDILVGRDPAP